MSIYGISFINKYTTKENLSETLSKCTRYLIILYSCVLFNCYQLLTTYYELIFSFLT